MSTINGQSFLDPRNINLKGGANGTGLIRWNPGQNALVNGGNWASNPFATDDYGLYINVAGQLVFSSLGSTTILGAAGGGGGGIPTWEQIFAADNTFDLAGTTWTIDNTTGGSDVLTLTNTGGGAGSLLQITNAGTGLDINGTSSTWNVSKAGAAVFLSATVTTSVTGTTGLTLSASGAGLITIGANSNTVTIAKALTLSSTLTATGGQAAFGTTSNIAADIIETNNTATTLGAGVSSLGLVVIRSTSLSTGNALLVQLADNGTLTSGYYFNAWDSASSASMFKVGAKGATSIAGSAFGTAALTVSLGDLVVSSGKVLATAASNAGASFLFTNSTATSVNVFGIIGAGTFTGVTTSSFMRLSPTGLTTGTALYVEATLASTSPAVIDVSVPALTSGSALRITGGTGVFTTGGKLIELSSTAAVAGNLLTATTTGAYTGTGMILVTAGAATTGVLVSLVSTTGLTTGSLLRATSSTAGAIQTNGAISFVGTGAFTSAAVTDGYVNVQANTTTAGTVMSISATSLTTGVGLYIANGTSSLTSGSLLQVVASGTGTLATNGAVSISHAGAYASTANSGLLDVQASGLVGTGTIVNIKATGTNQQTSNALNVQQSNTTTGYTGNFITFTGTSTTGASNLLLVTAANTTTGNAVKVVSNGLIAGTSTAVLVSHTTSVLGAGNSLLRISSTGVNTGTTTGTLLDLATTAATTGTAVLLTDSSADVSARIGVKINVTNAAAVGVTPLSIQNAAVVGANSKFVLLQKLGTVQIFAGIDAGGNDPNGQLTGVAGDVCYNGASNKPYYCTAAPTTWATVV